MFDQLDFVYQPSRDVAADLRYYVDILDATVVFTVQRFGTRVAMLELADGSPRVLLAEHLAGDRSILIFRVSDLDQAEQLITGRGGELGERFEMPYGIGRLLPSPAPQRVAIYQQTEPERGRSLAGRRDF